MAEDNGDDESLGIDYDAAEYDELIESLRNSTESKLCIESSGLFQAVFDRIDEFCSVLAASQGVSRVILKSERQLTAQSAASWNKLIQAVKNLCEHVTIEEFAVSALLLGNAALFEVLQTLPQSTTLRVHISFEEYDIDQQLEKFGSVSSHNQCEKVCLDMMGFYASADIGRTEGTITRVLRIGRLSELYMSKIELSLEDCVTLAEVLVSNTCTLVQLSLYGCKLHELGGQQLARAFGSNSTLENLSLVGSLEEASFRNELLFSLPSNKSIETLSIDIGDSWFWERGAFFTKLFRNIVCGNGKVKDLNMRDQTVGDIFGLAATETEAAKKEGREPKDLASLCDSNLSFLCDLSPNYTLEKVSGVGPNSPGQPILRLNRAGRSYLRDDPASASKSVDVLAKVKDDLDCLFVHIRENPVPLCSPKYLARNGGGNRNGNGNDWNKKRKADEITTDSQT